MWFVCTFEIMLKPMLNEIKQCIDMVNVLFLLKQNQNSRISNLVFSLTIEN
jgi:hypothetical protein